MEEGQKEDKKLKDERTHERKTNRTKEAKKRTKSNIQLNRKRKKKPVDGQWKEAQGKSQKGRGKKDTNKKGHARNTTERKKDRTPTLYFFHRASLPNLGPIRTLSETLQTLCLHMGRGGGPPPPPPV